MAGAWAILRHRPRATGCVLAWGAVCQLLGLLPRQGASGWRKMEGTKKQDPPADSGGWVLEGESEKFTEPFQLCPNFSSPGKQQGPFPTSAQFPPVSASSPAPLLLVSLKGKAVSVLLCIHTWHSSINVTGVQHRENWRPMRVKRQNSHETTRTWIDFDLIQAGNGVHLN